MLTACIEVELVSSVVKVEPQAATGIEPKTSAALLNVRCAVSHRAIEKS